MPKFRGKEGYHQSQNHIGRIFRRGIRSAGFVVVLPIENLDTLDERLDLGGLPHVDFLWRHALFNRQQAASLLMVVAGVISLLGLGFTQHTRLITC